MPSSSPHPKRRAASQDSDSNDVPEFRGNPARTGDLAGPDPNEPTVRHCFFQTEGSIKASPAIADGMVYRSSTDGFLYAIDATTGRANSTFEIGWSESSPAVADGTVNLGGSNTLYAIDLAQAMSDAYDVVERPG